MSDLARRLGRLERATPSAAPVAPSVDLDAVYRHLEAVGLARWDPQKDYWSPTAPRELRALLAERRGR